MVKPRVLVTSRQIADRLKARLCYDVSQKDIAAELGISQAYLSDFLAGRREVGPAILEALGYEPQPLYRRASRSHERKATP